MKKELFYDTKWVIKGVYRSIIENIIAKIDKDENTNKDK